jgi:hypothetical protein
MPVRAKYIAGNLTDLLTVVFRKTKHVIGLHGTAKIGHAIASSFVSVFLK